MHVRAFEPDDGQAALDLRVAAFSSAMHAAVGEATHTYVPDDRRLVAISDGPRDRGRVVGHLAVWPFRQVFGGRSVPMGGVAGVAVAMEQRGRGVGTALMAAGLDLLGDRGDVVSTLYPSWPGFYRGWGWEVAGERTRRRVRTSELASLPAAPGDVEVRPYDHPGDLEAVAELHDEVVADEPGGVLGGQRWVRRDLEPDDDEPEFAMVATRGDEVVGVLAGGKQAGAPGGDGGWSVEVRRLVGRDWDAERALWHVVAGNHPVATHTCFVAPPTATLLRHLAPATAEPTDGSHHWMTRIVDAPGAVAARGWPALRRNVVLALTDPRRARNTGTWQLVVDDGDAELLPADDATPEAHLDIRAFTTLWAGAITTHQLARSGELTVDGPGTLGLLAELFTTPSPHVRDYF